MIKCDMCGSEDVIGFKKCEEMEQETYVFRCFEHMGDK